MDTMAEAPPIRTPPKALSPRISPLKQHPVSSVPPTGTQDVTQTIIMNHPSAKLSSSPASSPRIIESPYRRGSVRPTMNGGMQNGIAPGFDFFDDGSSGSEWEDSDGEVTQVFTVNQGLGLQNATPDKKLRSSSLPRGRTRNLDGYPVHPAFRAIRMDDTDLGLDQERRVSSLPDSMPRKARPMSVTRHGSDSVRVVYNRSNTGTPRSSIASSDRGSTPPRPTTAMTKSKPIPISVPSKRTQELVHAPEPAFRTRHRRNTSGSASVIADSIIDAHVTTMRALEALNASPTHTPSRRQSRAFLTSPSRREFPHKLPSFTAIRHVTIRPLITDDDPDRPEHLPKHFVKTPYPFSAKKAFPKPESRPRMLHDSVDEKDERLDSGYMYSPEEEMRYGNDQKGKHVLGFMANRGSYDLRSRAERNEDAQGIVRGETAEGLEGLEGLQGVLWVSLRRRRRWRGGADEGRAAKIVIPSSLVADGGSEGKEKKVGRDVEFDDTVLAERLRSAHAELRGSWVKRLMSARKLKRIQLSPTCIWSGGPSQTADSRGRMSDLLSVGRGMTMDTETASPFTEDGLLKLYRDPMTGRARYTWVHWARRLAASNGSTRSRNDSSMDTITIVQFVHELSIARILLALCIMLLLSAAAALLWIFLGPATSNVIAGLQAQRSQRVGSGMAVGVLALLMQSVAFGAWVLLS